MMQIFGPTTITVEDAQAWARFRGAHQRFIDVIPLYFEICPRYNIPAENGIGQASHETNDGKYTGVLSPDYHNWCGLKTEKGGGNEDPHAHKKFDDDETGVLAHVQHLARYGGAQGPAPGDELVDPRWSKVTNFTDTIEGLGGSWAPSPTYGIRVRDRIESILRYAASRPKDDPPMSAQIPGFKWQPADSRHHTKGRTQKIRGGAQHYSAGTNSLAWLTTSPNSNVSAHFLVKHNPTMEDRGWQLVRLEDTSHTTAFANPYTVAIEYEHTGSGPIPDIAYDVLIQTWRDIHAYITQHKLGAIEKIAGHKEWVNNPTLICPDGIDIARIVRGYVGGSPGQPPPAPSPAPTVPPATKDPRGSGYWIPNVFLDEIKRHDWMTVGICKSGAFTEGNKVVQYFERARLELQPDGSVTRGLVGAEVLDYRYPNGTP